VEKQRTFFSIIVPTYNRPIQLEACLDSIGRLSYPKDRLEVIVVDDGGHLPLDKVIEVFRKKLNLVFISQKHSGPAIARNTGVARAKGDFLAFTDDDCRVDAEWLTILEAYVLKFKDVAIAGHVLNSIDHNIFSEASQMLLDYFYSYYNADFQNAKFINGNDMVFPVEAFKALGAFNVSIPYAGGEDREVCEKWMRSGRRILYVKEAKVHHYHSLNFRTFWKQHFTYGRGAYIFRNLRSSEDKKGIRIEPLSFYYNLLCFPFFRAETKRALSIFFLFFISQLANALGFFAEKFKCQKK